MKKLVFLLLGVGLIITGCSGNNEKADSTNNSEKRTVVSKSEVKKKRKTIDVPLTLAADSEGKLAVENGKYIPYLTISVPEKYGCLTYHTIFSETDDSGKEIAKEDYNQGSPEVKEWFEKPEEERYSGMPYQYVFCTSKNQRNSWFTYKLFNEENLNKMKEKYPTSDFGLYESKITENQKIDRDIENFPDRRTVLKEKQDSGKANGFDYTYDYTLCEDKKDKEKSLYCDYIFELGDGTQLIHSIKGFESDMDVEKFDPEQTAKEVASGVKLEATK